LKDLRIERKRHREEENRLFILEAAERVFSQKGYSVATMDDIAQEAQFSKVTLYRYFGSKRDILFEIILNSFEENARAMLRIHEKNIDASEKLKQIIRSSIQHFRKKKNMSRVFLMEKQLLRNLLQVFPDSQKTLSPPERKFLDEIKKKKERMMRILSHILEEGIESGEFREMNACDAAHAFEAMLHGYHFSKLWYEKECSLDTATNFIHEFYLHGVTKKQRKTI
jgi:AcrR family transcriptional regulator